MTGLPCIAEMAAWSVPLSQMPRGDWDHHMPWMGGGGMWMGLIMWILLLVLAVLAIIALWRVIRGGGATRSGGSDRSLDILRERFARGEIDEDEYEARRKALGG